MKRSLKRMMLLLAVLLTVIMPLHGVHAESVVKDGVSVTLSTDKDSYAPGETVKVNLLLKNNSGADLQNVTMENLTPAGCVPLPGATTIKTLIALANNGSVTHSTSFQVEKEIVPPKTGDDTPIFLWVSLALLSGCLLFALKRVGAKLTITMLLIVVLTASLLPVELAHADTAQTNPQQLTVKKNVAIKGMPTEVKSQVFYGQNMILPDIPTTDEHGLLFKHPEQEHVKYDEYNATYYVDNQILLIAKEGTPATKVQELVNGYGGRIVGMIEITDDYQIELKGQYTYSDMLILCSSLASNGYIEDAFPHTLYKTVSNTDTSDNITIPNDAMWPEELYNFNSFSESQSANFWLNWGIRAINAPEAWNYSNTMSTINVGVIDSNFYTSHRDLELKPQNVWNNPSSLATKEFHGTHVCGIIAAKHNNSRGIAGVSPTAQLYAYALEGNDVFTDDGLFVGYFEWKYALAKLILSKCKVINSDFPHRK